MELPVYENQVPVGTLRIRTQGLYTLFETRLPPGPGLSRLWLLGAGRRWSLGGAWACWSRGRRGAFSAAA